MANLELAIKYIQQKNNITPIPSVQTLTNSLNPGVDFAALEPQFKAIWKRILGDSIISQSVANILFELFLDNAPKAEEWLLGYIESKTGIPHDEINNTLIATLNKIIQTPNGIDEFKMAVKRFLAAEAKTWIVRIWNAVKSIFKGIF